MSHLSRFTLDEISAWTTKHIRSGSFIITDGLNCFPGVTQSQCEHKPVITHKGSLYDGKVFERLNTVIGNIKSAMHGTYHALSNKHLPRYLAEYCYRLNRRFEMHTMVDRLTYVALRTQPVPQRLLKLAEVRW